MERELSPRDDIMFNSCDQVFNSSERERERETETDREREREEQTDRQTERQRQSGREVEIKGTKHHGMTSC